MHVEFVHKGNRDFVLLPKEEFDSLLATVEVMRDADLMEQIEESKKAKSRPFEDVLRELDL
ncbi:MAG: hypothetical protein U9M95_00950 [Candidatus Altiarchaeota archaeon]|nr:hypothetical protein [Candidatus Altiarchaeota archaeon]